MQCYLLQYVLLCHNSFLWLFVNLIWGALWWALVISNYYHLLPQFMNDIDNPEFICLMMSAFHPSASATLFNFAFFDRPPEAFMGKLELCELDEVSQHILFNRPGIIRTPIFSPESLNLEKQSFFLYYQGDELLEEGTDLKCCHSFFSLRVSIAVTQRDHWWGTAWVIFVFYSSSCWQATLCFFFEVPILSQHH